MPINRLLKDIKHFPWWTTARTLLVRFREDRLGLQASSLTFTTTMALVPFFTVVLAVFTAFPMFDKLEGALQAWLVQSVIPDPIAKQVLGYLTQFAAKAGRLGTVGVAALFFTSIALVLTIDRTLNGIFRVRTQRSLGRRVLIYWAVLTFAPLMLGAMLSLTSYVAYASRGWAGALPGGVPLLFGALEFALLVAGLTGLYRWVPNTYVRPAHAFAGGLFSAAGIELARHILAVYLGKVPTYSVIYGAFATVPILLLWIYIVWLVVLWGAVIAAYLPSLLAHEHHPEQDAGWRFEVALEVLSALAGARSSAAKGLGVEQLTHSLHIDALQLEPLLEELSALDWIGRVNELKDDAAARYVLLADPATTLVAPLAEKLLLPHTPRTERFWGSSGIAAVLLKDAM